MGIGFVLMIWLVILIILGVPAALFFILIAYLVSRKASSKYRKRRMIFAAFLPYLMIAYFGFCFVIYSIWCVTLRHVDIGIGDGWCVPLGEGYTFEMIDIPDNAFISKAGKTQIYDIQLIAEKDCNLYGRTKNSYFMLDTQKNRVDYFDSKEKMKSSLVQKGIVDIPDFMTPNKFYRNKRYTIADVIEQITTGVVFLFILHKVWIKYLKEPKTAELNSECRVGS